MDLKNSLQHQEESVCRIVATIPNADGVIESTVPWCFGYGEEEWLSGATVVNDDGSVRPKRFSDYQDDATDDASLRISCN